MHYQIELNTLVTAMAYPNLRYGEFVEILWLLGTNQFTVALYKQILASEWSTLVL